MKLAEAELDGKELLADMFKNLILDLHETSYQIIVQTAVDSALIEIIRDTDSSATSIAHSRG